MNIIDWLETHDFGADCFELWLGNECVEHADGFLLYDHRGINWIAQNLPSGWKVYAIRHSDSNDREPTTLERKEVAVNFYGYFITESDLDWLFKAREFVEISDWNYTD